jgi:hypothetical protein
LSRTNKYTKKDAARDTGASTKQVSRAWHAARDDAAGKHGVPKDRHGDGGGGLCFIATATYGDPLAPEVQIFRNFRDTKLINNKFGKFFIFIYYKISPPIAKIIEKNIYLKKISRSILKLILRFIKN